MNRRLIIKSTAPSYKQPTFDVQVNLRPLTSKPHAHSITIHSVQKCVKHYSTKSLNIVHACAWTQVSIVAKTHLRQLYMVGTKVDAHSVSLKFIFVLPTHRKTFLPLFSWRALLMILENITKIKHTISRFNSCLFSSLSRLRRAQLIFA